MTHVLKTWRDAFTAIWTGHKRHEFRLNDREYLEGDTLVLQELDHCHQCDAKGLIKHSWGIEACPSCQGKKGIYTGREIHATVTHVGRPPDFGFPKGYAVMTIRLTGDVFEPQSP